MEEKTRLFSMIECLPNEDIDLLTSIVKKLIRAWDPDYTKVTPSERKRIEESMESRETGEILSHDDLFG